ncbi:MAG: HAMP domain-containing sensor histidine kinase [Nocardioides sp.]|uniref:sensor histidine kinase n=1 Tax=Nocardioides sp. TaxID=35761 RepID=UPI0032630C1F
MTRLPLRVRLVAGFLAAMLVVLTAAGAFVYWRVEYALDRGLDTELSQATTTINPLVAADGTITSPAAASATGAGWQVLDGTGAVLSSGGPAPATPMVAARSLPPPGGSRTIEIGSLLPRADTVFRVRVTSLDDSGMYLLVGVRRDHRDEALRELLLQLTLAGLGALVVAAIVGDLLARAALRPVERYRRRAAAIAGGASGLRLDVPAGRDDEVTRLGHTLNHMLDALERSLEHERRFVNDASHELRTPLTLLTSRIQLAQRRRRSADEHEQVLDELGVDVARLADLAEQLLALGMAGEPAADISDVTSVVAGIVERRRLAAPEMARRITTELPAHALLAAIDPTTLGRLVTNLVDNGLNHGQPPILIRARRTTGDPGWVVIEVQDAGPGMDPEMLAEATRRFARSPEARSRPGAGLGLALVEQSVVAAGGALRLCCHGHHVHHGAGIADDCDHGDAMTASLWLRAD